MGGSSLSSLPNLRVLSLSDCDLIGHSLQNFSNSLFAPVPELFCKLLKYDLIRSQLLRVEWNISRKDLPELIEGSFPEFPNNSALKRLALQLAKFFRAYSNIYLQSQKSYRSRLFLQELDCENKW